MPSLSYTPGVFRKWGSCQGVELRLIWTLLLISIAVTAEAEGPICGQIFAKTSSSWMDQEEYSWRRFQTPLRDQDTLSSVEKHWLKKIGSALHPVRYFFRMNKETIETVHLSPRQAVAVTRSNQGHFRIHRSDTGDILAVADLTGLRKTGGFNEDRREVIAVSDSHFVIGSESSTHILKNKSLSIKAFHPQSVYLFNFKGELVSQFSTSFRFKGNLLDLESWIVADQSDVQLINAQKGLNISIDVFYQTQHLLREGYSISAIGHSRTDQTLLVAYSRFRHHAKAPSHIAAYDISQPQQPRLVKAIQLDEAQVIYAIRESGGRLHVKYSAYEQSAQVPPQVINLDW